MATTQQPPKNDWAADEGDIGTSKRHPRNLERIEWEGREVDKGKIQGLFAQIETDAFPAQMSFPPLPRLPMRTVSPLSPLGN